jgi:hypothetical protein
MTTTKVATVTQSYRQSVESKYLPNSRRIKVRASGGEHGTYNYDDALDASENHALAIEKFLNFMNWSGTYTIGSNVSGTGYVAVWVGE